MVRIELTADEAETLHGICEDYLSDLRMEVSKTDRLEFREALKAKEDFLKALLRRLEAPANA